MALPLLASLPIYYSIPWRFVDAFTAHLFDFFFPGSSRSTSAAEQCDNFPDTLCKAPARQQFYNNTGERILFHPFNLKLDKDPNTGFDADFDAVESSFTMKCSAGGIPFNCDADLVLNGPPDAPYSATIDTNPNVTLAASVTSDLQSDMTLALGRGQGVANSSAVTADDEGNFGGVSASEAGQEPETTSTTDSIAQTAEQAAPGSGQASTNVGDQGAVIVSMNPGGVDGTL
ncbi:hypothetical protein BKA65DRAFT_538954 [Rhexocercosporidium sp. MPI-PUGE-AT-0058]|nr:hypothetical protein BKA65DRAFT_538954 [Rhexocercosporidium sp. MPI-PUGE-AT-0058]